MLEDAKYIQDFNEAWPSDLDSFIQCDDHIRLIKTVLKTTFPLFTTPVLMTGEELNNLGFALGSTTTHFNIGSVGFPVNFTGYIDLLSTNDNQYAFFDKDTKMMYKKDGIGVLGSIFWSILDNATMQLTYPGNIFHPCDGTTFPAGSEIERVFGVTQAPIFLNEALIMETTGAGNEIKVPDIIHKPYDTDTTRITGELKDPYKHKHEDDGTYTNSHRHQLLKITTNYLYYSNLTQEETWMRMEVATPPYSKTLKTPSLLTLLLPEDKHHHNLNWTNLYTETTPAAVFLNAFIRIN